MGRQIYLLSYTRTLILIFQKNEFRLIMNLCLDTAPRVFETAEVGTCEHSNGKSILHESQCNTAARQLKKEYIGPVNQKLTAPGCNVETSDHSKVYYNSFEVKIEPGINEMAYTNMKGIKVCQEG